MNIELRHLRYFVAVAEEASFTAAAHRVHVAQQALSIFSMYHCGEYICRFLFF